MLFSDQRRMQISVPSKDEEGAVANVGFLVKYLCQNVMKDQRKDLFVLDGAVYVPEQWIPWGIR
jgi:ubiquitin related modifier 1